MEEIKASLIIGLPIYIAISRRSRDDEKRERPCDSEVCKFTCEVPRVFPKNNSTIFRCRVNHLEIAYGY